MKLRYALTLSCLLGTGLFAGAQATKKTKPVVEDVQEMPVTVKSAKKTHKPPPPPPPVDKDGKPLPPPKVEMVKFRPPVIRKDNEHALPPPKVEMVKFKPPVIKKDDGPALPGKPEILLDKNGKPLPPPPPPPAPRKVDTKVKKTPPPPPPPVEKEKTDQ